MVRDATVPKAQYLKFAMLFQRPWEFLSAYFPRVGFGEGCNELIATNLKAATALAMGETGDLQQNWPAAIPVRCFTMAGLSDGCPFDNYKGLKHIDFFRRRLSAEGADGSERGTRTPNLRKPLKFYREAAPISRLPHV
jgi:hypothetical protein